MFSVSSRDVRIARFQYNILFFIVNFRFKLSRKEIGKGVIPFLFFVLLFLAQKELSVKKTKAGNDKGRKTENNFES